MAEDATERDDVTEPRKRTGWHCERCNHYVQRPDEEPPAECPYCGATGTLERISHAPDSLHDGLPDGLAVGATVVCEVHGEVEQSIVGTVLEVRADEVLVEADDGTGTYTVDPDQIVGVRDAG